MTVSCQLGVSVVTVRLQWRMSVVTLRCQCGVSRVHSSHDAPGDQDLFTAR